MADWLSNCKKQDFGTNGGSWARQPAIIVIHSTEGNSWPGYNDGQSAPHFTIDVRTNEKRQHISMGLAARALANPSGGVETNRAGAIQIEVIGTCDPNKKNNAGWLYLPNMTAQQQSNLASLMRDIADAKSISWVCSVSFKSYPNSYGTGNGVRLSGSAWNSYKGILGHQHVPENDHGDPGNIPISSIMASGDDMPLTDDDVNRIAQAVWNQLVTTITDDKTQTRMGTLLTWIHSDSKTGPKRGWDYGTTSPSDGSDQTALTLLRWAQGDSRTAATNTKPDSD